MLLLVVVAVPCFAAACDGCVDPIGVIDAGDDGDELPIGDAGRAGDAGARGDAGDDDEDGGDKTDAGVPGCDPVLDDFGDPDRDRVVLVGQPYAAEIPDDGLVIRSLTLSVTDGLVDDGIRTDVGTRPERIEFARGGAYALVLGEDGALVSVQVCSTQNLLVVDTVQLPSAGYGDIRVADDGRSALIVGANSTETGGLSRVTIADDGQLVVDAPAFLPLRLSYSIAMLGGGRALLLGGQVIYFEPQDPIDLHLLDVSGPAPVEVQGFDLWTDSVTPQRMAASPDGKYVLVPNNALFSAQTSQVQALEVTGNVVVERGRLLDLPDAAEAIFSPDGRHALVTQPQEDKVAIIDVDDGVFAVSGAIAGVGLADQMALVSRGALTGTVLVTSINQVGRIAILQFDAAAGAVDTGHVDLGAGLESIPNAVAIMP